MTHFRRKEKTLNFFFHTLLVGIFLSILIPTAFTLAATTVGNNVSVGGTLGVTGNTTLTGILTANGNVTLGNAASDTVTVTADVASSLLPEANNTRDLGAYGSAWNDIFASGTAYLGDVDINNVAYSWPSSQGSASTVLTNNGSGTLTWAAAGGGTNDWGRFATTYGTSAMMTSSTYPVWFDGNVYVSSTIYTSSTVFGVGTEGGPSITFAGDTDTGFYQDQANTLSLGVGGNAVFAWSADGVYPDSNGTFDLGSFDSSAWGDIFASGTVYASILSVDTGILPTSNNSNDFGGYTTAWRNMYASGTAYLGDVDINTVGYTWPSSQGGASTVLTNNGSGTLTWAAAGGGTNDWGRFNTTYGALAMQTSSTYPVWFDGNVFSSGTSYLEVTEFNLGAGEKVFINASSTVNTGTAGVLDIDHRTGTSNSYGLNVTTHLTANNDNSAGIRSAISSEAAGDGDGAYAFLIDMSASGSEVDYSYYGLYANAFVGAHAGAGGSFIGNDSGWTNAALFTSGNIVFDDYAPTIRTRADNAAGTNLTIRGGDADDDDGVGSPGADFNGGNLVLYGGAKANGGSDGYVKIGQAGGTPTMTLTDDDIYVKGQFEIDGLARFDGNLAINTSTSPIEMSVHNASATSTLQVNSGGAGLGGRMILEDVDGAGCSEVTALNGTLTAKAVACP